MVWVKSAYHLLCNILFNPGSTQVVYIAGVKFLSSQRNHYYQRWLLSNVFKSRMLASALMYAEHLLTSGLEVNRSARLKAVKYENQPRFPLICHYVTFCIMAAETCQLWLDGSYSLWNLSGTYQSQSTIYLNLDVA